jgi:hypothetical protein
MKGAIRAIASAAFATALIAIFHSGLAGAQTSETDPGEKKPELTEETASESPEATPIAPKPSPAKRSKKVSKPFEPTEKIEAESVISFPTNI